MELSTPRQNTLKISTKKGFVLVDSDIVEEAKIVILNDDVGFEVKDTPEALIIYGPGDYESNGILVKGNRVDGGVVYSVDSGEGRVLVANSKSIAKLTDEDDYDAVVVKADDKIDESHISSISSKLVVVYGDGENVSEGVKSHKVNKLNLKKHDDLGSNVVYLEKK